MKKGNLVAKVGIADFGPKFGCGFWGCVFFGMGGVFFWNGQNLDEDSAVSFLGVHILL